MYAYKKKINMSISKAIEKTKEELKKEGFGVLTQIDVKTTLKEKLNIDREDYVILGACNPTLAHKALEQEQDLGLMLPCNVIVYVKEGKTIVAAIKPTVQMEKIGNPKLNEIAMQVEEKLKRVIDSV
ncbi:MAG: DUF302 domain-containing protein [Candidatus Woesearchaeota archaeon]|nr:DUF302 domain-containing protein [Candidatus Woesearchaeota archaeon]